MRRSHALLAFIAVAFLVLSTGWAFAGEGKVKPDPFLALQQQIDELNQQVQAFFYPGIRDRF